MQNGRFSADTLPLQRKPGKSLAAPKECLDAHASDASNGTHAIQILSNNQFRRATCQVDIWLAISAASSAQTFCNR